MKRRVMNLSIGGRFRRLLALSIIALVIALFGTADSAEAFCEDRTDGSSCHVHLTDPLANAIRPELLDYINERILDPDDYGLTNPWDYASDDHFDACNFDGAVERINDRYLGPYDAVGYLAPIGRGAQGYVSFQPEVSAGLAKWAYILHAVQDFYAHTNWPEMTFVGILSEDDLIDEQLIPWQNISSNWDVVRTNPNIIASQENLPDGWGYDRPFSGDLQPRLPRVYDTNGQSYWLLTSGTSAWDPTQGCPTYLSMHHDDLNKDNIFRPYHAIAARMARAQTLHEWCRLLALSRQEVGIPGMSVLMGLVAQPDYAVGHSACETFPGAGVQVNVTLLSADLNADQQTRTRNVTPVLTLYTTNFVRHAGEQLPTVTVSATSSPALPTVTETVCMARPETLVATVQAWEEASEPGVLNPAEIAYVGASASFAGGTIDNMTAPQTVALTSDSPYTQQIAAQIQVDNQLTDVDGDGLFHCDELVLGTDPQSADSDGDGLSDGDELSQGTDPTTADSDGDGVNDGSDAFPLDPAEWNDSDDDGVGDNGDNCAIANPDQQDSNNDGQGDACDPVATAVSGPASPVNIDDQQITPVSVSGAFTDGDDDDAHSATWEWGDGTATAGIVDQAANTVSGSHVYGSAGVYTVTLTVSDSYPASDAALYQYIVIYDQDGGFVTGSGNITSPAGACPTGSFCEGQSGDARFGFVSKYQKGTSVPSGQTVFRFKAGNLDFHSDTYHWLVVNQGGKNAQFKGEGTIDGQGVYQFMIWAGDQTGTNGEDTFRIRIWSEINGSETVVYDNGTDQAINAGNIKVHSGK